MRLIGEKELRATVKRNYPSAAKWTESWIDMVKKADWRNIAELHHTYPSADGVAISNGSVVTVFDVRHNKYRLLVIIEYDKRMVIYRDFLTHADYQKNRWKK